MIDTIKEKIEINSLPLDIDITISNVKEYETIYPGKSYQERFFMYVLNTIGAFLTPLNETASEILGWLKMRNVNDVYFFEFESPEDYYNWLSVRVDLYSKLNNDQMRLMNYLELTMVDFIRDTSTTCTYKYIDNDSSFTKVKDDDTLKNIVQEFRNKKTYKPI